MFKHKRNRYLSLFLALAMVMTLFSGVNLTVKAEAPAYRNVMYYGDWSIWGGQETSIRRTFLRIS